MNRTTASGFFSILSSSVLVLAVTAVTTPVLYRLLGPAGYGRYAFVLSVFMVFMIFVNAGVSDGVRKFLAEDRDLPGWDGLVVGFYLKLAAVLAAAGAGLLLLVAETGLVARYVGSTFVPYFELLAVLVVAGQFREFVRKTLMGFGLERYSEPLNVLKKVTFGAVAIAMVSLGFGVPGALVGDVAASVVVIAIGTGLVLRRVSVRALFRRPPAAFPRRDLFTFNTLSILLVLLMMSLYHADVIMLQLFDGSRSVGYYKAALNLAEFLWFVPLAVQTVFVHSTSELWSRGRRDHITELVSRTTRYTLLVTAVMALGIAALANVVVPLYFGFNARPAVTPLLLLLPGALGFAAARPIVAVAQGKGDLWPPIAATGVAAALNVGLNLALIPRYGMAGAAVATSVGYGSMFGLHLWSARRLGFDPLADARPVRVGLTTALAAGPILWLPSAVGNGLLSLVVVPPLGLALFVALALATGALDPLEPFEVLGAFPTPIGPLVGRLEGSVRSLAEGGSRE